MPLQKIEQYELGGVDSRSNPLNFPSNRAVRCTNFVPTPSGRLRLRFGNTKPALTGAVAGTPIHSATYYEQYAGAQFALFGQGTALKSLNLSTGVVTDLGAGFTSGNPWGHFRASNRIFVGNGVDGVFNFDGTTLRPTGVRAPTAAEVSSATATVTGAPAGTWDTTVLGGFQIYIVYYNPVTGEVGNRIAIGSRFTNLAAAKSVALANLPDLSGVNTEWVKGIGRTNDGGQVPYWLVDASGNRIVVGNAATTASLLTSTIDTNQELPTRNGLPPTGLNKFTRVGNRVFAARDGDVNLYFSEDDTDAQNGNFVGVAQTSFAGNNLEPMPTGEVPTALHAYRFEGWFFSKNNLAIWSQFLFQQGSNPWRGPWPAGAAGQRAFIETPYGPVWMTPDKQLMGFSEDGPIPVSGEFEKALLGQIGDQYVATTELAYYRNPELQIDCIYIKSRDVNGNQLNIKMDYMIRDGRSATGQGYLLVYSNMTPNTFIGSGLTPRQNLRDSNGRERLWTGATDGAFYQMEDGDDDNAQTYTGDYIGLMNAGTQNKLIAGFEWQGDQNVQVSYSGNTKKGVADWTGTNPKRLDPKDSASDSDRFEASISREAKWVYIRLQLTSHPADGTLEIEGEELPVSTYGYVNYVVPKLGSPRPEGR